MKKWALLIVLLLITASLVYAIDDASDVSDVVVDKDIFDNVDEAELPPNLITSSLIKDTNFNPLEIIANYQLCDFSDPVAIKTLTDKPNSASVVCPERNKCYSLYIVDGAAKDKIFFSVFDGNSWSSPLAVHSSNVALADIDIACRSSNNCIATFKKDNKAFFMAYNGAWNAPQIFFNKPVVSGSLSCNSEYCAYVFSAIGVNGISKIMAKVYTTSWSAASTIGKSPLNHALPSVSCYDNGCLAVWQGETTAKQWDLYFSKYSSSWSQKQLIQSTTQKETRPSVSCANSNYCMVACKGIPNKKSVAVRTYDGN